MRRNLAPLATLLLLAACVGPPPGKTAVEHSPEPTAARPATTRTQYTLVDDSVDAEDRIVRVQLDDVTDGREDAAVTIVLDDVTNAPEPATPHVDPDALAPSFRDHAEAALGANDLEAAERHYLAWLQADPSDANSWYNLACVQSLRGDLEPALLSFRASLNAGFDQLDHANQDSDLDAIRADPRFAAALAAAVEKAAERALPGMERHAVLTETIGTYVVLLPPDYAGSDRTYPLCVLLHGSGSDEISHAKVSGPMGRTDVIYIAPRALQSHVGATISRGHAGWTVWPPDAHGEDAGVRPMSVHVEWIFRCIDDALARYRIESDRVAIWGHSQGAASAVTCAALHPERVSSICAYAGYYPEPEVTDARVAAMVEHNVGIHLGHARDDRVVDPAGTEAFETRLRGAGATSFDVRWFEDGGHALSPDVTAWSTEWLRAFVDGAR